MADPPGFRQEYLPISTLTNYPVAQTSFDPVNISGNSITPQNYHKGYYWKPWSPGQPVPIHAVEGGYDIDGSRIYVGRSYHEGDLIPAKVIPEKRSAYIPFGGQEVSLGHCEVLCEQRFTWVPGCNGEVPPGAVAIGHTCDGETLYAGRVYHEGSHTIGKVQPSHQVCYIPFDGKEMPHSEYETLVAAPY